MTINNSLAHALAREHREIDAEIEAFAAAFACHEHSSDSLIRALHALRRHIYMEEEFLFPSARVGGMDVTIFLMHSEHKKIWCLLDQIETSLASGDRGSSIQNTYRELMMLLAVHNHREEQVLYRGIDTLLSVEGSQNLMEFLTFGKMPLDWTVDGNGS